MEPPTNPGRFTWRCSAATKEGAPARTNHLTVRIDELEERALTALRDDMMQPDVAEVVVAEYVRERDWLSRQRDASRDERDAELRGVTARVERLKAETLNGVAASLLADELNRMGRRKAALEAEMAAGAGAAPPALLHPRLAQVYRGKVECLLQTFETEGARSEAQEIIRSLIDAVLMTSDGGVIRAEVKGDLATMLALASETKKAPKADAFEAMQVALVAGTVSDRTLTNRSAIVVAGTGFDRTRAEQPPPGGPVC